MEMVGEGDVYGYGGEERGGEGVEGEARRMRMVWRVWIRCAVEKEGWLEVEERGCVRWMEGEVVKKVGKEEVIFGGG